MASIYKSVFLEYKISMVIMCQIYHNRSVKRLMRFDEARISF